MADMIFPTLKTANDSMGKVNMLNADFIQQRLAELRVAGDSNKMPADLLEHFKSKNNEGKDTKEKSDKDKSEKENDDDKDDEKNDTSDHDEDDNDPEFIKKALSEMDNIVAEDKSDKSDEPCVCGDPDCPECSKKTRSSSNRVVRFTDADLTSDAVQKDIDAGNIEMARARLAARQERRARVERRSIVAATEYAKKQRLAERKDYRKQIVAAVQEQKQVVANIATPTKSQKGFKASAQMENAERQIIAKILSDSDDFPIEFIEAALLENSVVERTAQEETGREILASSISENSKRVSMREIIANLTPESRKRAIDYWINDLGYGDQEWVRDLFSASYD